jgi:hypothetical protein
MSPLNNEHGARQQQQSLLCAANATTSTLGTDSDSNGSSSRFVFFWLD